MLVRTTVLSAACLGISFMLFAGAQADVTSGLRAHWKLDETAGETAADAVGVYDATLRGDAAWLNDAQRGHVLGVDGVQDAAVWLPTITRPINLPAGTLLGWVKLDAAGADAVRFAFPGQSIAGGNRVYLYSNNGEFAVGLGNTSNLGSTGKLLDTGWHQIALAWDDGATVDGSGDFTAFFDGQAALSGSYAGLTVPATWFSIGSNYDPGDVPPISSGWMGEVSDVGAWNRPLTVGEVADLHAAGQIGAGVPGMTAHWTLGEATGETVAQDSVGGHHAALQGDAAFVMDAERGQVLTVDGSLDNALYLDPTPPPPPVNLAAGTVLGWAKLDAGAEGAFRMILPGQSMPGGNRVYLYSNNGRFGVGLGNQSNLGDTGSVFDAEWHQVALAWNDGDTVDGAGDFVAYFDGEAVLSGAYEGLLTPAGWLSLGSNYDPGDVPPISSEWKGQIDEVGIWNRALTSDEVREIYQAGQIVPEPSSVTLLVFTALFALALARRNRSQ